LINNQINATKQNIPILDVLLSGANMGFLKHAIKDCPVGRFFKGRKKDTPTKVS
jgi:hypothetical protein